MCFPVLPPIGTPAIATSRPAVGGGSWSLSQKKGYTISWACTCTARYCRRLAARGGSAPAPSWCVNPRCSVFPRLLAAFARRLRMAHLADDDASAASGRFARPARNAACAQRPTAGALHPAPVSAFFAASAFFFFSLASAGLDARRAASKIKGSDRVIFILQAR